MSIWSEEIFPEQMTFWRNMVFTQWQLWKWKLASSVMLLDFTLTVLTFWLSLFRFVSVISVLHHFSPFSLSFFHLGQSGRKCEKLWSATCPPSKFKCLPSGNTRHGQPDPVVAHSTCVNLCLVAAPLTKWEAVRGSKENRCRGETKTQNYKKSAKLYLQYFNSNSTWNICKNLYI